MVVPRCFALVSSVQRDDSLVTSRFPQAGAVRGGPSGVPRANTFFPRRHAFARFVAAATFVLIFVGGLVTSTGSSLAVPDWPLSYGQFFPPMVGGVLFEHGHRMVAGTVAILTIALAVWTWLEEPRAAVRGLAGIAVTAVFMQAGLGGITVLLRLPPAVSISHAALAQAFFCLVVALALLTSRGWVSRHDIGAADTTLQTLALATTVAVYLQLLVGATVRHTGSGLAIPDFPLAYGRIVPPLGSFPVAIHFAHRVGAVVVTTFAGATASRIFAVHRRNATLTRPAQLLAALVAIQLSLGAAIIWTHKAVIPTTSHVAVGAAILATALVIALRSARSGIAERSWAQPSAARASA